MHSHHLKAACLWGLNAKQTCWVFSHQSTSALCSFLQVTDPWEPQKRRPKTRKKLHIFHWNAEETTTGTSVYWFRQSQRFHMSKCLLLWHNCFNLLQPSDWINTTLWTPTYSLFLLQHPPTSSFIPSMPRWKIDKIIFPLYIYVYTLRHLLFLQNLNIMEVIFILLGRTYSKKWTQGFRAPVSVCLPESFHWSWPCVQLALLLFPFVSLTQFV